MISPSSIPVYGAEAIVNTKLLQLLSNSNYEIDLISKKNMWENYPPESDIDELNVNLCRIEIVSVDNKFTLKTIWLHFMAFLTFGTVFKGAHWAYVVISRYRDLFESSRYDYVITKNSPGFLVGFYLKRKFGYKWVASWNDPYPSVKYPEPYGKGVDAKLSWYERNILKIMEQADVHIFPSSRLKNYMSKYINVQDSSSYVIPHVVFKNESISKSWIGYLNILHSGNVRSPRNPFIFISALRKLLENNPGILIKVDFVGVYDSSFLDFIADSKLEHIVSLHPSTKYSDSLKMLSNYNLAMLIEAPVDEGIFLPTKVGDYMHAGMPIFAISPEDGLLNDLYKDGYIQYFANNRSEESIYSELKKICLDFNRNELKEGKFYEPYGVDQILKSYLAISN